MSERPIVVLGVTGMLGHKMFQHLSGQFPNVLGTCRDLVTSERFREVAILRDPRILQGVDAESLEALVRRLRPSWIVNCVGVIKQREAASEAVPSILINSLLPHRLAATAAQWGGRVIHFSTDCVFSGRQGMYREEDISDATDLYGRSKFLGEVAAANALTLRTSIIGRELAEFRSLLEWFLARRGGKVQGYRKAMWSGVTTNYLSSLVAWIMASHPSLHGLYQVAAQPISKYDLLCLIQRVYGLDIAIEAVEGEVCDRTLRGDRFVAATGIETPAWEQLIGELHSDTTPYDEWRTSQYAAAS